MVILVNKSRRGVMLLNTEIGKFRLGSSIINTNYAKLIIGKNQHFYI